MRRSALTLVVRATFSTLATLVMLSSPANAQQAADTARWEWLPRPSLRIGDALRVDFRFKLQADWRRFPEELEPDSGTFAVVRRRVGVEGWVARVFEYKVEYDLQGNGAWTDVFVNVRRFRAVEAQAGRFKIPFSLDQTTGITNLDFISRTAIGRDLAPGRDVGGMVHGRLLDEVLALGYEAGMFRHDGNQARFGENPGADATLAARVTLRPFRALRRRAPLRSLEVGVAATTGDVPEGPGPNSLRARTIGGAPIFYEAYVHGRRTRLGSQLSWEPGPFSLKGEVVRIRDARRGQGLLADDLPGLIYTGWYVSSTWVLTGERKAGGVDAAKPLFAGGFGAVEVAARYERVRFGSSDASEPPEANPRSANLVETGTDAWTAGVNWYLNRWLRIQANGVRESFDEVDRSPVAGRGAFWSGVCRLQFVL